MNREARDWLLTALAEGEQRLDSLQDRAFAAGLDWRAIEAAGRRLNVRVYRSQAHRTFNGTDPAKNTFWVLPHEQGPPGTTGLVEKEVLMSKRQA